MPVGDSDWPHSLLAVIDGSASAETALVAQAALGAELSCAAHLCCVRIDGHQEYLAAIERAFSYASQTRTIERATDAHALAREVGADLLVVAGETDGVRELCRRARIPVLVIMVIMGRASAQGRYPRLAKIIVGLDGSTAAEASLPFVRRLQSIGAKVTLLVVLDGDVSPTPWDRAEPDASNFHGSRSSSMRRDRGGAQRVDMCEDAHVTYP